MPKKANPPRPKPCKTCGKVFQPPLGVTGRPPSYCSAECRSNKPRPKPQNYPGHKPHGVLKLAPEVKNRRKQARFQANVTSRGNKAGARDKKARIDKFIALIAQGKLRVEAEAEVGVATNTVEQWFKRDPEVKRRYNMARDKARGEWVPEVVDYDDAFVEKYFGFPTPSHLKEIREGILEVHELAKETKEPKAILILAPPDHAKSTEVENYLCHRIATDPNVRSLLISKTLGAARKRTGRIQRRLTDRSRYEEFVDTFGPFKSEDRVDARPWRTDYFTVIGQNSGERDYTLEALGIGGQIYGTRSEVIVLDDIADLNNQTPAEIDKQLDYIQVEVASRLLEDGILIVIGTHMRERDIYTRLEELGMFDKVLKFQAINLDEDGNEKALWPERYPLRRLNNIKAKREPRIWELVYQQNPLPSVGSVFTQEMIESCFDDDRKIGHIPEGSIVVAGVDPSVSNYTAGVVFAVKGNRRYLVDVWNEKGLTGEGGDNHAGVVEFIVELCRVYGVSVLCVEDGTWMTYINNSQTLHDQLFELGVTHHGVKVGPASGTNEADAIGQLSGLFSHRMINLPGTPAARLRLQTMIHQFITWTGDKQHWRKAFDIVKAFRQAEYAARNLTVSGKAHLPMSGGDDVPDFLLEEVAVA